MDQCQMHKRNAQMHIILCTKGQMHILCTNGQALKCSNAQMPKCANAQMLKCLLVHLQNQNGEHKKKQTTHDSNALA